LAGFDICAVRRRDTRRLGYPIRLVEAEQQRYYGREPVAGIAQALKIVTLTARAHGWAEKTFGYKWADAAKDPGAEMGNVFAIEDTLNKTGAARAATADANSMIYTAKANQLYNLGDDVK
jgi:homoserine O-acetyltransferase